MGCKVTKQVKISDKNTVSKQIFNSYKKTEIKYLEGDKIFVECRDGFLLEFSMISKTIIHDFGRIKDKYISSVTKALDKKS